MCISLIRTSPRLGASHLANMLAHRLATSAAGLMLLLLPPSALAVDLSLPSLQTGGIYADGGLNNLPTFQNYFVGYGTTPGTPRTAERRSFFVFDLSAVPGDMTVTSATLELRLPFGGLIFGKGPGDPLIEPVLSETMESFMVGLIDLPSAFVLSELPPGPAIALFGMMTGIPVASPTVFMAGDELVPPGDGGPPIVSVPLDGSGLFALNAKKGSEIVFSGWMPSWSPDTRPHPSPPPAFFESSELIFGLTDVHADFILTPKLVLTLTPVPEPATALLWLLGLGGVLAWRRRMPLGHPTGG